ARPICFRLLMHCDRRAASRAACTAGSRSAIRTAMIAITTSSSIRVKPRRGRGYMGPPPLREQGQSGTDDGRTRPDTGGFVRLLLVPLVIPVEHLLLVGRHRRGVLDLRRVGPPRPAATPAAKADGARTHGDQPRDRQNRPDATH